MKKTLTLCLALMLLLGAVMASSGFAETPQAEESAIEEADQEAVEPQSAAPASAADGIAYEAETAGNTMTGNASVSDCEGCSGGKKVGGLYQGSSLRMTGIAVAEAGSYYAVIDYISGDPRSADISVNGGAAKHVEFKKTADWNTVGTQTVMVDLAAGANEIAFDDGNGYSPDIDRMTIVPAAQRYEGEAAGNTLSGNASVNDCAACSDGKKVGNLYQGASVRVNGIQVPEAGAYEITVHYVSGDPRSFSVSVNDGPAQSILFAKTADWDTVGTRKINVALQAGDNSILFADGGGYAPDLDRITVAPLAGEVVAGCEQAAADPQPPAGEPVRTKAFGAITVKEYAGHVLIEQGASAILYDLDSGLASYRWNGKTIAKGVYSKFGDLASSCYGEHRFAMDEVKPVTDGFGIGIEATFVNEESGKPVLRQTYSIYAGQPFFLTRTEAEGDGELAANYFAPLVTNTKGGIDIGSYEDARVLAVPYDNDMWVRYQAVPINASDTSYEVTAVYDNASRDGLVLGSVTHDTWKTGIDFIGEANKLNALSAYGGASSAKTHDSQSHGTVTGANLTSPTIFVGYYDDYRDGLEAYGEANAVIAPPLAFASGVPQGVPVGWNSWGARGSSLSYQDVIDTSNYYKNQLRAMNNDGITYINMDSYWDNLSDQQLADAVAAIRANGQKAGIYWGPFVYWGNNMEQPVDGSSYKYGDIVLRDQDGNPLPTLDGAYAVDPTHPGTQERMDYFLGKFERLGFEYIKLDFLTHGALEGKHYDTDVQTGTQAYNEGMTYVTNAVGNSMFISASIAPMFPSQYAHSRRIATDTFGSIGDTEYQLNALTYGWWQNGTIYRYTDPDHMTLAQAATLEEARSRVNSAVITGTVFLGSDDVNDPKAQDYMRALYANEAVLAVAKKGKSFRAIEGDTGAKAAESFVLGDGGAYYLAVFNYGGEAAEKPVSLERAGLDANRTYVATELWSGATSNVKATLAVSLGAAASKLYKLTPVSDGGSNPTPGGGATAPNPPVTPEKKSDGDLSAAVKVQPSTDGSAAAQVDTEGALALIKQAKEGTTTFAIKLTATSAVSGMTIHIARTLADQAIEAAGKHAAARFESPFGTYTITFAKLQSAADEKGNVQIGIGEPKAEEMAALEAVLPADYETLESAAIRIGTAQETGSVAQSSPPYGDLAVMHSFLLDMKPDGAQSVFVIRFDGSGDLVPIPAKLHKRPDGRYESTFPSSGFGSYAVISGSRSFADANGHWAEASINRLASQLVLNGESGDVFAPNEPVTRAVFASLLVRAIGLGGEGASLPSAFVDVEGKAWFTGNVGTAVAAGLAQGAADGRFRPDDVITRQEMVVMLIKALSLFQPNTQSDTGAAADGSLSSFADGAAASDWARQALAAAVQAGLLQGNAAGELLPRHPATRAETAVLLDRLLDMLGFTMAKS
ncbi:S-layer homology domain-containing protein [Paenibacillus methanolicus]|uniref:S-layer family protein n=1 Tax=Paenibacillus methanolicus TaxID=582686 RepID=A0A5S5CHE3_9BACL|nr:S-layer homology domain-containing protein [Paenibacillus methanolicus]TYP79180.1 S-layer family protein [Paenibacillus methanolicus]